MAVIISPLLNPKWKRHTTTPAIADTLVWELFNAHTYGRVWFADKHPGQIAVQVRLHGSIQDPSWPSLSGMRDPLVGWTHVRWDLAAHWVGSH